MKKLFSLLVVLVLGIFLAGCTYHVVPAIHPVDPALVPDLKGGHAVCVVNISTATGKTILGIIGGDKYMGDLHKWTNTAVALLQLELQKRGFMMRDGGNDTKVIKLAVSSVRFEADMVTSCYVTLHLETGNGYSRNYVTCKSAFSYHKASDVSVTMAVTDILNDKKVIEYLQATK